LPPVHNPRKGITVENRIIRDIITASVIIAIVKLIIIVRG
jgi:hypothetical protein